MNCVIALGVAYVLCAAADDADDGALVQMKTRTKAAAKVRLSTAVRVDLRDATSDVGDATLGSTPTTKSEESSLYSWYPTSLTGSGEGVQVHMTKFSNAEHTQLLKPDEGALYSGNDQRVVPLKEFIQEQVTAPTSLFMSFKVARCGSTLLDSMLAQDPRFLLVAEPAVMNQVAGAIPGNSKKEQDLRRQLYRALVFRLASPLTNQQEVGFLDFNSQTSKVLAEVVAAVPEAHSLLLWRKPIEVSDSLFHKPPGWLTSMAWHNATFRKARSTELVQNETRLWAIEGHMENVINGLTTHKNQSDIDVPVFYYQQVTNGILPRWIVDKAFRGVTPDDEDRIQSMMAAAQIDSKTGQPWPEGKIDHNELELDSNLKEEGVVWYNPKLVDFDAKLSPVISQKHMMGGNVKELRWPEDREAIESFLRGENRHEPVLVRNALASTELAGKNAEQMYKMVRQESEKESQYDRPLNILEAEKENYFVWHSRFGAKRAQYHVVSKWGSATWDEFEKDPKKQIIDHLPPTIVDKLWVNSSVLKLSPEQMQGRARGSMSLRISHQGAQTALHYDCGDTVLWQLGGAKEFIIWPRSELPNLYTYGRGHLMFRRALADPEYMDPQNLPNFSLSKALYARAGPGDLIFWPSQWAHHIRTVESPSISAGARWNWPEDEFGFPEGAPTELVEKIESLRYAKGFRTGIKTNETVEDASLIQFANDFDDDDPL